MKRFVCALVLILAGCSENAPRQAFTPPPVPVQTAKVEIRDVPFYFEEMATVVASQIVEIKPQVSGVINEISFQEGSFVEKGDLLYVIDTGYYAIKVQEAEAQLLQNLTHLNNAQKKLDRYKSLSKQDLIAKVEWDELESKIALYEALVKADGAKLNLAKRDLDHCYIKAPISGRTGKTSLQAGNVLTPGISLVTLSKGDPFNVDFFMTEKEMRSLSSKMPSFEIYAAGGAECLGSGTLTFVDSSMHVGFGMFAARGLLTKVSAPLSAGQIVRIHVFFGSKEKGQLVPLRAIKTNQLGSYVFTVTEDNTVEMRSVKLGPEEKGMILVEEGLSDATKVVVTGHLRLYPGAKIEDLP
ncbi:MAG: efflux RND transporter periplasmic adaptor subunit [Chlamydiota bacterium]